MKNIILSLVLLLSTLLTACVDLGELKNPIIEEPPNSVQTNSIDGITRKILKISHPDQKNHNTLEIHLFEIDPQKIQFKITTFKDIKEAKSIKEIHDQNKSLLTYNGIFFDENFKTLGLLISESKEISPFRKSALSNGIFAIQSQDSTFYPKIFQTNLSLEEKAKTEFAIQNGPILIDQTGTVKFTKETGNYASRTVIGITNENKIALIFIPRSFTKLDNQVTLFQLGNLLKTHTEFTKLGLHSVLNLDGGVSVGYKYLSTYEPELDYVQNIIYSTQRSK